MKELKISIIMAIFWILSAMFVVDYVNSEECGGCGTPPCNWCIEFESGGWLWKLCTPTDNETEE